MTTVLVWIGLALASFWAARCYQVGCTRMLPVAALVTGLFALWTAPGQALREWLAHGMVLCARLLAWAAGPFLMIWLCAWLLHVLARHPARAGTPARWVALSVMLGLGTVGALLLEPLPSAAEPAAGRVAEAAADVGWWLASFVPDP